MKKKLYMKLIAVTVTFLFAMTALVSASYAWFQMSTNPVVEGIQVSISGGSTILIAADLTQTVDGVTYHYPDVFSDTLSFAQHDSYAYLQNLAGLRPVSTADGINWFIADKYDANDLKVQNGEAVVGQVCDVEDMIRDVALNYANLTDAEEDAEKLAKGHYICMDFWVVSPGSDYYLRISTSDEGGSFVIDLMDPEETEDGYTLSGSISSTAASVRVGFLATPDQVTDDKVMELYQQSDSYDEKYTALRGVYQEPGGSSTYSENYNFTIYEPNADAHPSGVAEEGSYVQTFPVGLVNDVPRRISVLNRTTVQKTTTWTMADQGDPLIGQIFQTALIGDKISGSDAMEFYSGYLQNQFAPYVDPGAFIRDTSRIYGDMTAEIFGSLETAGATDDVYIIQLQKNVPQRIRMYIWLEGQDVDWNPKDAASSFVLNLELAGGTE